MFASSRVQTVRGTQNMYTRDCAYSLGWEGMGGIVKLDERMVVVGLAVDAGLPLAEDDLKVVTPDGGPIQ